MPIFKKFIKPIKDKVMHFIEKVKNFFTGGMIGRVQIRVDSVITKANDVKATFEALKDKFETLKNAINTGLLGIVLWAVDFFIALVCEHRSLLKAVK